MESLETEEKELPNKSLHWQIILASTLGVVVGLIVNGIQISPDIFLIEVLGKLNHFIGDLFIRGLRFVAVPIVLFSLIAGVGSLNDLRKLGRIGSKTIAFYLCTTAIAISLGLLLANLIAPGKYISAELRDSLAQEGAIIAQEKMSKATAPDVWETLLNIVPKNPFSALAQGEMLQVVFFSMVIGLGLAMLPKKESQPILDFFDVMTKVIINIVTVLMKLAPLAVFCLLAGVTAKLGLDILAALAVYSLVVVLGLFCLLVLYPILVRVIADIPIRRFYTAIAPAQLLAFSSSSSSATMPITLKCVENHLEVDRDVSRFVIPLGATINMDGTALYQGVAALFIAQMYGIDLDLGQQLTIVLTATLASVGTAGVPGVGLIMLVIVLQSVGMSTEVMTGGLAVIFGVDRILDMCRTVINVTGDCTVATLIGHWEKGRKVQP